MADLRNSHTPDLAYTGNLFGMEVDSTHTQQKRIMGGWKCFSYNINL